MTKFQTIGLIGGGVIASAVMFALMATWLFSQPNAKQPALEPATRVLADLTNQIIQLRSEKDQLVRDLEERSRKQQTVPPAPAAKSAVASILLGREVKAQGLTPANQQHDGVTEATVMDGVECHQLQRYPGRPELYAYFVIDPAFKKSEGTNSVIVEVEYLDADAGGHFRLDYDSFDESSRSAGAYTQSKERVNLRGAGRWRNVRFLLDDAAFQGRQNDQSDFRIAVVGGRFFLRSVKVVREE